jgi:hypothetical protein
MKIQPSNIIKNGRRKIIDPLDCFSNPKPSELTQEEFDDARSFAMENPTRIQQNLREVAYGRFYQRFSFEEIASTLSLDINSLIYTAIYDNWFEKVKKEKRVRGGETVERADKTLMSVLMKVLDATQVAYSHQLSQVIQNPELANECSLIPKNIKELKELASIFQSLQSKEVPTENKSNGVTTVNVQNLISSAGGVSSQRTVPTTAKSLPEHSESGDFLCDDINDSSEEAAKQLNILNLLKKAKGGN